MPSDPVAGIRDPSSLPGATSAPAAAFASYGRGFSGLSFGPEGLGQPGGPRVVMASGQQPPPSRRARRSLAAAFVAPVASSGPATVGMVPAAVGATFSSSAASLSFAAQQPLQQPSSLRQQSQKLPHPATAVADASAALIDLSHQGSFSDLAHLRTQRTVGAATSPPRPFAPITPRIDSDPAITQQQAAAAVAMLSRSGSVASRPSPSIAQAPFTGAAAVARQGGAVGTETRLRASSASRTMSPSRDQEGFASLPPMVASATASSAPGADVVVDAGDQLVPAAVPSRRQNSIRGLAGSFDGEAAGGYSGASAGASREASGEEDLATESHRHAGFAVASQELLLDGFDDEPHAGAEAAGHTGGGRVSGDSRGSPGHGAGAAEGSGTTQSTTPSDGAGDSGSEESSYGAPSADEREPSEVPLGPGHKPGGAADGQGGQEAVPAVPEMTSQPTAGSGSVAARSEDAVAGSEADVAGFMAAAVGMAGLPVAPLAPALFRQSTSVNSAWSEPAAAASSTRR